MRLNSLHRADKLKIRSLASRPRIRLMFNVLIAMAIMLGGNLRAAPPSAETVRYDSAGSKIDALLVRPSQTGKHPAILVIHDSEGLNDGMRDVALQLAAAGFVALVPDLLSRSGGMANAKSVDAAVTRLSPEQTVQDLLAGIAFLESDPGVDSAKISSLGFGWGGWRSFRLAAESPNLNHAVIFYGATPVNGLENIHASVLANYAQYDFFDTGNSIWTEDTLQRFGTKFTCYIYPKTFRGFFDPSGAHYNADAAKLAWTRTLEFLKS